MNLKEIINNEIDMYIRLRNTRLDLEKELKDLKKEYPDPNLEIEFEKLNNEDAIKEIIKLQKINKTEIEAIKSNLLLVKKQRKSDNTFIQITLWFLIFVLTALLFLKILV
ncbi:hypothetical protein [Persephonella sp.]